MEIDLFYSPTYKGSIALLVSWILYIQTSSSWWKLQLDLDFVVEIDLFYIQTSISWWKLQLDLDFVVEIDLFYSPTYKGSIASPYWILLL